MSRILEFQPMDEQTVISRVLIELHQAIDHNFPQATPVGRQFTKTVLTNQGDSTRVDNVPSKQSLEVRPPNTPHASSGASRSKTNPSAAARPLSEFSMTPKTNYGAKAQQELLHTADVRRMIGESRFSRMSRLFLWLSLLVGIAAGVWLVFFRFES